MTELHVLISRQQIADRISAMAAEIAQDFPHQPVVLIGVLKGAAIFLADLARQLPLDASFDFIGMASYGTRPDPEDELRLGWDSSGQVRFTKDVEQSLAGKNIIIIEDILDTGLTLTRLMKHLLAHRPRNIKIAALLDKPSRRRENIHADYVGFTIPDEFVVGYGMDYAEMYRNLPDICVLPRQ